jgi:hypothetical protein
METEVSRQSMNRPMNSMPDNLHANVAVVILRQRGQLLLARNSKRQTFNFPMTKIRERFDEREQFLAIESPETAAGRAALEVLGPAPIPRSRLASICTFTRLGQSDVNNQLKDYTYFIFLMNLRDDEQVMCDHPVVWLSPDQILEREPIASIAGDLLEHPQVKAVLG